MEWRGVRRSEIEWRSMGHQFPLMITRKMPTSHWQKPCLLVGLFNRCYHLMEGMSQIQVRGNMYTDSDAHPIS